MTKLFSCIFALVAFSTFSQSYNPFYGSIVANVNYDSVLVNLTEFANLGVKEIGMQELDDTKNWLIENYQSYGYTDIVEDVFSYGGSSTANLIVTKQGELHPDKYVIIDGHYDTKNGVGANDNGSGTSIILEIARLLKDIPTEYSIKFIHFSGEEDGLIGSHHYVDNTVIPNDLDIKVVFNIDQVGGVSGLVNNTIVCEEDTGVPISNNSESSAMTLVLANCIELYSPLSTEISYAYGSDYMPFEDNGEIITGLYEKNVSPFGHTAQDIMDHIDTNYVYEITQGATGAALEYAVAFENNNGLKESIINYSLFPNPTNGMVHLNSTELGNIDFKIYITDLQGRLLGKHNYFGNLPIKIDLSDFEKGPYFISLKTEFGTKTQKIQLN